MLKKIIITSSILLSTSAFCGTWINEITGGCATVAGANYMMNTSVDTQTLVIGCLAGGTIGYVVKSYADKEASEKYQKKINAYKNMNDEIVRERAINNSMGLEGTGLQMRKRYVPAKKLKNGGYILGTFAIEPYVPGSNVIIGD